MAKVIPVMRVFDYSKTVEFYVEWLGFKIEWEDRSEDGPFYMRISLQGIFIDLSGHNGECSPGAKISLTEFKGLTDYHTSLRNKGYKFMNPGLERVEWDQNTLEMTVIDPFYNYIIFNETIKQEQIF